ITPFKAALGDFYLTQGRFPTEDEFADVFADLEDTSIAPQIEVEPDTGVIVLYVKHEKLGDNNRVYFTPSTEDGTVQWSCRADFDSPVIRQACQ
ncbi:MAG: hypothetical protein FJZ47_14010, partial [Candidatus Tectomicrobia bacterium]|nr:hypothetical protein [Candidatus Tectomicrobia bacterium]